MMSSDISTNPIPPVRRSFLRRGVSIIGTLAILSGGSTLAQTAETAPDLAPTDAPSPQALETPSFAVPPSALRQEPPAPEALPTVESTRSTPAASAAAPSSADESYIDSTGYNIGATERSSDVAKRPEIPGVPTTVRMGPIAVGDYGIVTPGRTTPTVRDYYYRTLRPPGRLGNGNIRLIFPLSIPAPITSIFGWRIHPITGDQRFHSGTDLGAPLGTPVLAAYAGRVALADFLGGYGLAIALDHNKGTQQTLYGHLSEIFVKPGEWVKQGMVIGRVGSTGLSTGPHLHFEFRQLTPQGWVVMDPGAQLEYALAQLTKSFNVASATADGFGSDDAVDLGAINLGAKGDSKIDIEALKKLGAAL